MKTEQYVLSSNCNEEVVTRRWLGKQIKSKNAELSPAVTVGVNRRDEQPTLI